MMTRRKGLHMFRIDASIVGLTTYYMSATADLFLPNIFDLQLVCGCGTYGYRRLIVLIIFLKETDSMGDLYQFLKEENFLFFRLQKQIWLWNLWHLVPKRMWWLLPKVLWQHRGLKNQYENGEAWRRFVYSQASHCPPSPFENMSCGVSFGNCSLKLLDLES